MKGSSLGKQVWPIIPINGVSPASGINALTKLFSAGKRQKIISNLLETRKVGFGLLVLCPVLIIGLGINVAYASTGGETEGGKNWLDFAWRAFNFVVLAGIFYWLLAAKIKAFFLGRQEEVKTVLAELAKAKEEAEKKFAEYSAKLEQATEEIQSLSEMIRRQGLAEKERIIAAAQKTAEKMKEDGRKRMEQEIKMARQELQAEAVHLSLQMAQRLLQKNITETDHAAMVEDYIDKVVSKH